MREVDRSLHAMGMQTMRSYGVHTVHQEIDGVRRHLPWLPSNAESVPAAIDGRGEQEFREALLQVSLEPEKKPRVEGDLGLG